MHQFAVLVSKYVDSVRELKPFTPHLNVYGSKFL